MRKLGLLVFVVSFLFLTYSPTHAADVIKLKLANYMPPTHGNSILMDEFCAELNKKLAGKVELTHYPGGILLTPTRMATGISTGIADIGLSIVAYSRGRFPVMETLELPLGFPSGWIGTHVVNDFYNKFKPKDFDEYHVLLLSMSTTTIVQTVNKPIRTLEDLRGVKLRGVGRIGDTIKALGATPVPVEAPDLYDSLKKGVIDGMMLTVEPMKSYRLAEVQKYVTESSWKVGNSLCFYVLMNKQKWDSLPADVQKVFNEVSNEFIERWAVKWNEVEIEGRDFFIKQGGQMILLSNAESARWVKAVKPVISDYKKDLLSKGYKADEIESWLSFLTKRIEYWKGQEKARHIPTPWKW